MSALESLAIEPTVYYTIEETADLLRVSPQEILSLLESGRIRGLRIDHGWRVLGSALLDLTLGEEASESTHVSEWFAVSAKSLKEVWDNEEDSVYDQL
jgi:excisionase family DNA binding protein